MLNCMYPVWLYIQVCNLSYMVGQLCWHTYVLYGWTYVWKYVTCNLSYMVGHFFLHVHVNHVWLEFSVCNLS